MLRRKKKQEGIPNDLYVVPEREVKPGHAGWYARSSEWRKPKAKWCKVCGYKHSRIDDHENLRVVHELPPKESK